MPYNTHGATASEAETNAATNGPNKPYSGGTHSGSVSVTSGVQCIGGFCTAWVSSITFGEITVSIPHWVEFSKASASQQSEWTSFLDSLIKHENGHVLLDANVHLREQGAVEKVGATGKSADSALRNISNKIHAVEARYNTISKQWNANYDQQTCHGECQ
jgi:predicted secreted Zn-dependent protease